MITPHTLADGSSTKYGFGLGISEVSGKEIYRHSGGIFGFVSYAIYIPDEEIIIVVFANSDSPQTIPNKLARDIATMLLN